MFNGSNNGWKSLWNIGRTFTYRYTIGFNQIVPILYSDKRNNTKTIFIFSVLALFKKKAKLKKNMRSFSDLLWNIFNENKI